MGFWTLFEVASIPILEVLIISVLGAFMATNYLNLLNTDARKSLNKLVFVVFTPALMIASLAKTVTLEDIISWWFMPINIGITFLIGGTLGWIAVKILKPKPHLEGVVIATCASGNLGNLLLIIVPAICSESGSPFGDSETCASLGLSYASFSMALGGFYIWTYTYHLIRSSAMRYKAITESEELSKEPNVNLDADEKTNLLEGESPEGEFQEHVAIVVPSTKSTEVDAENQNIVTQESESGLQQENTLWSRCKGVLHKILEELLAPPTVGAIVGFIIGAVPWLKKLIIGDDAPLRVIQDCFKLLGEATIPCITLILGGNLTQGFQKATLRPLIIIAVICVRYIILPVIGIGIVKAAGNLGFLPSESLFRFVLMIQFTLPPAMNVGTMTQLFEVGEAESSVLFLWTYLVAALALTVWSTIYMWILS
ncbi:hypothetical protein RJ639_042812 [Escallonia herrerae]|uniref:Auxin efflux carrier family protein n=1 Tax=Escallonia herrerae TaxID=1293975 RepID=A0AA88WB74_9ASTE|nr:hypothetical protein RJ639_042812 [Escallonia herrerae]